MEETFSQIGFGESVDDDNDDWEGVVLLCDCTETVEQSLEFNFLIF